MQPAPPSAAAGRVKWASAALFAAPLPACAWCLRHKAAAGAFFEATAVYFMAAILLAWLLALAPYARRAGVAFLREHAAGLLFCLALAAAVYTAVPPEFRVLADESNLLGVSRSMAFDRRADIVTMGKNIFFDLRPLRREHEKRPPMYPFLTAIVHAATGYRPQNAFAVNFLLLAALLGAVFVFFRRLYNAPAAYAAVLLAAAQPVTALAASSGGMDFMSAAFMFFAFLAARKYAAEPGRESFALLCGTLLMLANVRYEGPLLAAAAFGALALCGKVRREDLFSPTFLVVPLLLLPAFCQRFCLPTDFENQAGNAAFSAAYLAANAAAFLKTQLDFSFFFPYAPPVSLAGAAGAAWFARGLLTRRSPADSGPRAAGCAAAAGLAAYALLLLPYYAGSASYQAASRLFVPAALSLSLLAAALLGELSLARPGARGLLAAAAAGTFLLYLPVAAENKFMDLLILTRQHRIETKFLRDKGDKNVLVVSDRPRLFTALGYGAVNYEYARGGSAELLEELDRKLFSRLLVMQEISYETGKPTPATDPGPAYSLEPLFERQNTAESYLRISAASRAAAGARRVP